MHCSIVNHINPETPEQPVNRTSLVVLDIECIENNTVKELGGYKDGQTLGYSFVPHKNSNQHSNLFGVQSIFMELVGAAVMKNMLI